jgi:hypothetical protein
MNSAALDPFNVIVVSVHEMHATDEEGFFMKVTEGLIVVS